MTQKGVSYTSTIGYLHKYCPYSTNHKNKYYNNGFFGNVGNEILTTYANPSLVPTADHDFTDGTLVMASRPGCPGWLCLDDACPYFTTNGVRYFTI